MFYCPKRHISPSVAFIPEGLPVAVTLSLAKVAHTLSKNKIVCKQVSMSVSSGQNRLIHISDLFLLSRL